MIVYIQYLLLSTCQSYIDQFIIQELHISVFALILLQSLVQTLISYLYIKIQRIDMLFIDLQASNKWYTYGSICLKSIQYQIALVMYMYLMQNCPVSLISSATLFSPTITWLLFNVISIFNQQINTKQDSFKPLNDTVSQAIYRQLMVINDVQIDATPQILYNRKSKVGQFSLKSKDFEIIHREQCQNLLQIPFNSHVIANDNDQSYLKSLQQKDEHILSKCHNNGLLKEITDIRYQILLTDDQQEFTEIQEFVSSIIYEPPNIYDIEDQRSFQCQIQPILSEIQPNLSYIQDIDITFQMNQSERQAISSLISQKAQQSYQQVALQNYDNRSQTVICSQMSQSTLNRSHCTQYNDYLECDFQKAENGNSSQLFEHIQTRNTQIQHQKVECFDKIYCSFIKEIALFVISIVSVILVVLGSKNTQSEQGLPILYLCIYVINQSFGSLMFQIGKNLDPWLQIFYVNISIIPLTLVLFAINDSYSLYLFLNSKTQGNPIFVRSSVFFSSQSNQFYIFIVFGIVLFSQYMQILASYKKISFFRLHDQRVQQNLLFVPVIIRLLLDICIKHVHFSSIQYIGIYLLICVCLVNIYTLYLKFQVRNTDNFTKV